MSCKGEGQCVQGTNIYGRIDRGGGERRRQKERGESEGWRERERGKRHGIINVNVVRCVIAKDISLNDNTINVSKITRNCDLMLIISGVFPC